MSFLSDAEIREFISQEPPLVEKYLDLDKQAQPNGFEMTVAEVYELNGAGAVDFDNSGRKTPEKKLLSFGEDGWLHLNPGVYSIVLNEIVNIPKNIGAVAYHRSSLTRSGVVLGTAVWDAGYSGRSECLVIVHNPAGFDMKKNARVMQLLFFRLGTDAANLYNGVYQNENVKK
ncbi:dCTP deaminase, dUMP-forming [Methanimicrococcus sp. At1]|uniref:dCTP deaminase, dUMP-forming n=1 Tax=Methanimicrococcus hacksteinii TaxID=3028293 RepID=A0ABU3VPT5_9EURY|nr:deoxyuridine 5'-triphosphate nucleotidohydrolase [Methanimicrococcus sp. At1]MDV0445429.1 dCTP deaminase, dUMP-forming [Methanimicrococcus sp. At1]